MKLQLPLFTVATAVAMTTTPKSVLAEQRNTNVAFVSVGHRKRSLPISTRSTTAAFVPTATATTTRRTINKSPHMTLSVSTSTPLSSSTIADTPSGFQTNNYSNNNDDPNMPLMGDDGIYELSSQEEHAALMRFAKDKIVVLKVYAPWCRACKGLAPKFQQFANDPKYNEDIPIIWASLSIQHSKAFVKSLGVLALPTVQFYIGGELLETFGCGPSKVPILKRKLGALINDHVEPVSRQLKQSSIEEAANQAELAATRVKEQAAARLEQQKLANSYDEADSLLTSEERRIFMKIPYMRELQLADFDHLLEKVRVLTFEPGHIIVRQGRPGRLFYVIKSGEVEISQPTGSEDPMISSGYLGTVINRLGPGDYFGERSLITGELRQASVRATEPITIWAFDTDDFPESSILSGRSTGLARTSTEIAILDDKYGLDMRSQLDAITKQLRESSYANQVRGSVNNPYKIKGVDDDQSQASDTEQDLVEWDDDEEDIAQSNEVITSGMPNIPDGDAIFTLLTRFQMIQHVKTCFEYIVESHASWGDPSVRARRNLLVQRLSASQATEFTSTFKLIDINNDGSIELLELKRVLESVGNKQSDDEFLRKIMSNASRVNHSATPILTYEDFMGLMAEAEFYTLFRNIFASLDENNTGYVKAHELDRLLCGVRDLISDDHKSVIDVEDQDMSIDYEQFARMLLGKPLL